MAGTDPADTLRRAIARHQAGALDEAEQLYREVLLLRPEEPDALNLLGALAHQRGDPERAIDLISRSVALRPGHAGASANLGRALRAAGRIEDAVSQLRRALKLDPSPPESWDALASALEAAGDLDEAERSYGEALRRGPRFAAAHNNIGNLMRRRGRLAEARRHIERALALLPGHPVVQSSLATLLLDEGRAPEAEATLRKVIAADPGSGEAHNNLGNALLALGRPDDAAASYAEAARLLPEAAEPESNLGAALVESGRFEAALPRFERALERRPDYVEALSGVVWCRQNLCRWDGLQALADRLLELVERRIAEGLPPALPPFRSLCLDTTPAQQRRVAEAHAQTMPVAPEAAPTLRRSRQNDPRIRLGYLSWDFHSHATMLLLDDLFALHDRERFTVSVYSYGPDDGSGARRRAQQQADRFIDVRDEAPAATARRMRADGVDILVDLKGHTHGNRAAIMALRPAPVQVGWLGYPATTGMRTIDYILTDPVITPAGDAEHFTEQPVRLPHSYQINPSWKGEPPAPPPRTGLGLPEEAVVLCCFNNGYKITPEVFDGWMRILHAVPGAVLWLLAEGDTVEGNLRREARARGVDAARLIFAPRVSGAMHLARQRCADLFLDTRPVCAHTTARDALWTGLPLLTCPGRTFISRVAASLLKAQGLDDLVAEDMAAYEATAIRLAGDRAALASLRERVEAARVTGPLFDAPRFVRGLESAYNGMWRRHQAGEPPRLFDVDPLENLQQ